MGSFQPIAYPPNTGFSGFNLSVLSNTTASVSAGSCLDSTNTFFIPTTVATTLDFGVNGINGLDTGSIAASSDYAIYVIYSPQFYNNPLYPIGFIASLNRTGTPVLPFGYRVLQRVGWLKTDGSSHLLKFIQYGGGGTKFYQWDAPISVISSITNSFAAYPLTAGLPPQQSLALFGGTFTAVTTAGDKLSFRPTGSSDATGVAVASGPVQNQAFVISPFLFFTGLNGTPAPSIDAEATSGSDTLAINVIGFYDYV